MEDLFEYVRVTATILLNNFINNIIIIIITIIILVGVGIRKKNNTKGREYNILLNVLYIYNVNIGNFIIYCINIYIAIIM